MILLICLAAGTVAAQEPLGQAAGWAVDEAAPLIPIAGGSELLLTPDPAARVLEVLPETRLPLVESRGRWVKVAYGEQVGWVDLEGGREPGDVPPVKIVVAEPEPEPLGLDESWRQSELGPYTLFTKVDDPELIDELAAVTGEHARLYAERYGLAVDAELDGRVVLFDGRRAFFDFQRERGHGEAEGRIDAYFHSPQTVVMYRGINPRFKLAATLIHELTHLINWQTLRDGGRRLTPMPPWLEEGMAEDMSLARLERGRLLAEPLSPANLRYSRRLGARLLLLERQMTPSGTAPALPELLAMDSNAFLAVERELGYLMSAMWIRFLMSDAEPGLVAGFRSFLASVADGGEPDAEELRSRLGYEWPRLANGFRAWLGRQRMRVGL